MAQTLPTSPIGPLPKSDKAATHNPHPPNHRLIQRLPGNSRRMDDRGANPPTLKGSFKITVDYIPKNVIIFLGMFMRFYAAVSTQIYFDCWVNRCDFGGGQDGD
jgi:hypothetical protein